MGGITEFPSFPDFPGPASGLTLSDSSSPPPPSPLPDSSPPPPLPDSSPPPPPDSDSPPPDTAPPPPDESSPSPPPPPEPRASPPPAPQAPDSSSSPSPPETTPSPPPANASPNSSSSTSTSPPPPQLAAPALNTSTPSLPEGNNSSVSSTPSSGGTSLSPISSSPSSSTPSQSGFIIGGVLLGIFVIAAVIVIATCCSKKKKRKQYYDPPPLQGDYNNSPSNWNSPQPPDHIVKFHQGQQHQPSWGSQPPANLSNEFSSPSASSMGLGHNQSSFTYDQLATATNGFSQANMLGQGGFGYVHKGVLPGGKEVAVKSLKTGSGQGEREFQAEVEIISRVHHRHLVSLVGYCIAGEKRILVYEFVPNKTMEFHLHGKGRPVMDWASRLRIALGSAKGLGYLHEDCHPRIIHRDIKAANILLDNNFEAMVADFGLAKLSSDNNTHVSTRVMGTFGYLAPEYASSGKLTEKSDVFSFGVMLLELITGRKPVDASSSYMEDSLVDWARPLLTRALEEGTYDALVDPLLENNYNREEMAHMVACAAACIRHSARRRPKMTQIVRALEGDSSLDDLIDGPKPTHYSNHGSPESGLYDTGAYNADMMKFRKMVMADHTMTSSEYGETSEYGLNTSTSSSDCSNHSGPQRQNL